MTEGYSHKAAHIVEHIILAIALIWAGGCTLIWMQTDMSHRIVNAKSADGTCEVTISELGSPIFFGPSSITVKVSWDTDPGGRRFKSCPRYQRNPVFQRKVAEIPGFILP